MKKAIKTFMFFILLVLIFLSTGISFSEPLKPGFDIDGFIPGQPIEKLSGLGMPFPNDCAGWHIFTNDNENYLKFQFAKKQDWYINKIQLEDKEMVSSELLNNSHLMLTGKVIEKMRTGRNLGLGNSAGELEDAYGKPHKEFEKRNRKVWIYKNSDLYLTYIMINDKIKSILLEKR
ncbi:MAG: hypothetical protein ACLFQV_01870 [Vulcanimicrobiota bacterium]